MTANGAPAAGPWRLVLVALVLVTGLGACGDHGGSGRAQLPVPIEPGDTCAVCGMYITHYPGPRGEAYIQGQKAPLKFGSTRDFFAYVLQPQHRALLETLYVQDTAIIDWQHPRDHWIDARKAWYVPETAFRGAMGPTLAPFLHRRDAEAFVQRYGGRVLRYWEVTLQVITDLSFDRSPDGRSAGPGARPTGPGGDKGAGREKSPAPAAE